jgi:hypothetical protein
MPVLHWFKTRRVELGVMFATLLRVTCVVPCAYPAVQSYTAVGCST